MEDDGWRFVCDVCGKILHLGGKLVHCPQGCDYDVSMACSERRVWPREAASANEASSSSTVPENKEMFIPGAVEGRAVDLKKFSTVRSKPSELASKTGDTNIFPNPCGISKEDKRRSVFHRSSGVLILILACGIICCLCGVGNANIRTSRGGTSSATYSLCYL